MRIKWSQRKINNIISIIYGILSASVLIFTLLAINELVKEQSDGRIYLFFVFLTLMLSRFLIAFFKSPLFNGEKIQFIKSLVFGGVYLVVSILVLSLSKQQQLFVSLLYVLYFSTVIANRICLIIERKKVASIIFNSFFAFMAFLLMTFALVGFTEEQVVLLLTVLLVVIVAVSFMDVLMYAFSKIQLKGLLNIIRKTYVFEILYGMIILVISCSFYFMIMEDNVKTFGDGLWYSFMIITTIGFGDYTVTSTISRVLSVILGIYGIIVVASITSVIVNYYNEVKSEEKETKKIDQNEEPQEEEEPHEEE